MMKLTVDYKEIWKNQEIDSRTLTTRDKVSNLGFANCYIGRIGASNAKMFQIEVSENISMDRNYLKRFHGVEIRVLNLNDKKNITIILSDNDLMDVFILFLEDLTYALESIKLESDIPHIINEKVSYWGKLFARVNGVLLSKERQRGLYGELSFLNALLSQSSDYKNCIDSWTGPEGTNQDFSNNLKAVEVKTSKATKPSVNIASELQLDWTRLESLYLYVFHLDILNNGGHTLCELIKEIKQKLLKFNDILSFFEKKLDIIGVPVGDEKYYDDFGFILRSQQAYKLSDGFPALTIENINNVAIHNVKYQIDLTACEPFEVDYENVIKEMI
ncbi:MAG: PD-(D/E)XK motif protein [Bacteroidetes bacterium]|nr:PD-(D/E)XK motif protein [Bacteroidota bacterium]